MAKNQDRSEQYVRQVADETHRADQKGCGTLAKTLETVAVCFLCWSCGRDGAKRIGPEMQK